MRLSNALLASLFAGLFFAAGPTKAQERLRRPRPPGRGGTRGAPAPIAGTGLSFVALAGIYWLVRRRISRANESREVLLDATQKRRSGADG